MTTLISRYDLMAALLLDLAAARCRQDRPATAAAIKALQARGWDAPMDAAERVMRAAVDEEKRARPRP